MVVLGKNDLFRNDATSPLVLKQFPGRRDLAAIAATHGILVVDVNADEISEGPSRKPPAGDRRPPGYAAPPQSETTGYQAKLIVGVGHGVAAAGECMQIGGTNIKTVSLEVGKVAVRELAHFDPAGDGRKASGATVRSVAFAFAARLVLFRAKFMCDKRSR